MGGSNLDLILNSLLGDDDARRRLAQVPQTLGFAAPATSIEDGIRKAPQNAMAMPLPGLAGPRMPPTASAPVTGTPAPARTPFLSALDQLGLPTVSPQTRFGPDGRPEIVTDDGTGSIPLDELTDSRNRFLKDPANRDAAERELSQHDYTIGGTFRRSGERNSDALNRFLQTWHDNDVADPQWPKSARIGDDGHVFDADPAGTGHELSQDEFRQWLRNNQPDREPDPSGQFDLFRRR